MNKLKGIGVFLLCWLIGMMIVGLAIGLGRVIINHWDWIPYGFLMGVSFLVGMFIFVIVKNWNTQIKFYW